MGTGLKFLVRRFLGIILGLTT